MSLASLLPLAQTAYGTANNSNAAGWLFGLGGMLAVFVLLLILASIALIVWAIVDLIGNPRIEGTLKIVWALVILFMPFLGSLIYLIIGRSASESASSRT